MSRDRESKRSGSGPQGKPDGGVATPPLSPGLWLVATPIGNAADITLRALDVLARADVLAAEDTRRTRQLLDIHGVSLNARKMISYHDRNGAQRRPQILALLAEGKSVAYASDAGTPLIADPGYRLAAEVRDAGYEVHAAPGASAVLTALSLSGLPTDRFLFAGFLPPRQSARRKALSELAAVPATLVFYESPRRVAATLGDMAETLGADRDVALTRELTKKFEEVRRGTLGTLAAELAGQDAPRGEIVLVVGGPSGTRENDAEDLDHLLSEALQTLGTKDAAREVATRTGLPRREVYARALVLSGR